MLAGGDIINGLMSVSNSGAETWLHTYLSPSQLPSIAVEAQTDPEAQEDILKTHFPTLHVTPLVPPLTLSITETIVSDSYSHFPVY